MSCFWLWIILESPQFAETAWFCRRISWDFMGCRRMYLVLDMLPQSSHAGTWQRIDEPGTIHLLDWSKYSNQGKNVLAYVCVCICICICICILYVCIYMCIYIHIYAYMCRYSFIHWSIHVFIYSLIYFFIDNVYIYYNNYYYYIYTYCVL